MALWKMDGEPFPSGKDDSHYLVYVLGVYVLGPFGPQAQQKNDSKQLC